MINIEYNIELINILSYVKAVMLVTHSKNTPVPFPTIVIQPLYGLYVSAMFFITQ